MIGCRLKENQETRRWDIMQNPGLHLDQGETFYYFKKIGQLVNFEYGPYFIHTLTQTHTLKRACKCGKILTSNPGER